MQYNVLKFNTKSGLNVEIGSFEDFEDAIKLAKNKNANVWHGFSKMIGGQFDVYENIFNEKNNAIKVAGENKITSLGKLAHGYAMYYETAVSIIEHNYINNIKILQSKGIK